MSNDKAWTPATAGEFRDITSEYQQQQREWLPDDHDAAIQEIRDRFGLSVEEAEAELDWRTSPTNEMRIYESDLYRVFVNPTGNPGFVHLSIRPLCGTARHDWRELQSIKNALVGVECEAVELYPAESRLMDEANQFHLWASTDPTFRFPCGSQRRIVADMPGAVGCTQRSRSGVNFRMDQKGRTRRV